MPLTTEQSQALMRIYDARQAENRKIHEKRYEKVLSVIPEYAGLEHKISQNALDFTKKALYGEGDAAEICTLLENTNQPLIAEKKRLLRENGFPEDYLLPIYTCPDCQDTGYVKDDRGIMEKCRCYVKLASEIPFEDILAAKIPEDACFENFNYNYYSSREMDEDTMQTHRENITEITDYFKNYLKNYPDTFCNHLIYGNVGVGKTYLSYCIINELKKKAFPWVYLTAYEFIDLAEQNAFSGQDSSQKCISRQQFKEAVNADFLVLDDLGSGLCNSFTTSQLFLCINERQLKHKPTIITTNLTMEDLKQNYGERIFSRILGDYNLIRITGDDLRYKKHF